MKAMMTKARAGMDEFMAKQLESATPEERRGSRRVWHDEPQGASRQPVQQVVATGEHKTISGVRLREVHREARRQEVETIWAQKTWRVQSMKRDLQDISDRWLRHWG